MLRRLQIYKLARKINHLMYTANIKMFTENEKELEF